MSKGVVWKRKCNRPCLFVVPSFVTSGRWTRQSACITACFDFTLVRYTHAGGTGADSLGGKHTQAAISRQYAMCFFLVPRDEPKETANRLLTKWNRMPSKAAISGKRKVFPFFLARHFHNAIIMAGTTDGSLCFVRVSFRLFTRRPRGFSCTGRSAPYTTDEWRFRRQPHSTARVCVLIDNYSTTSGATRARGLNFRFSLAHSGRLLLR